MLELICDMQADIAKRGRSVQGQVHGNENIVAIHGGGAHGPGFGKGGAVVQTAPIGLDGEGCGHLRVRDKGGVFNKLPGENMFAR